MEYLLTIEWEPYPRPTGYCSGCIISDSVTSDFYFYYLVDLVTHLEKFRLIRARQNLIHKIRRDLNKILVKKTIQYVEETLV